MRSDICRIENGTRDLEAILKESERVAEYNGLDHKAALQLRLLCEELDGMLPNLIDNFEGSFWIEYEDGVCKVNASIKIPEFNASKKEELIAVSKNKKNAKAVGIVGKIRDAIENFFLDEEAVSAYNASYGMFHTATAYGEGIDYTYLWSLEQYRNNINKDENVEEWDELEKSIIAAASDDVIVGIKGNQADIIIVKKFA